jgi:predicted NACHT family NTPase
MASLPRAFLQKAAQRYKLTDLEQEAFTERLADMDPPDLVVAKILNISRDRYSTRMTNVYRKFNINGNTPGKAWTLFHKVLELYQKENPSDAFDINAIAINELASEVQAKISPLIREKCGTMKILDMSSPIDIEKIFTEVKIKEEITHNRYLDIPTLKEKLTSGAKDDTRKISGLHLITHTPKLFVLGKPGAGKTTFLKYITIFCNQGKILDNHIPAFVSLRDFCNQLEHKNLESYIITAFQRCEVSNENLAILLKNGKVIFLLDGLDEVKSSDFSRVVDQIRHLSYQYHNNRFVITCRLASNEYKFSNFAEVEICDFSDNQIQEFAKNWFLSNGKPTKLEPFLEALETNDRIKELASNPLLLTLLCIVFEGSGDFYSNRSELYQEGLDVLLRKWDASRDIDRESHQAYKSLPRGRKQDLLSQVAYATFSRDEYIFGRRSIESEIETYIRNLPKAITQPDSVEVDCRAILKSLEAQHGLIIEVSKGIYQYSHRTFQEFFVSHKIVKTLDPEEQKLILNTLVEHIHESRWREVFLLVSCMLNNADYLIKLMKAKIDSLIADKDSIRDFISWLHRKTNSITANSSPIWLKPYSQVLLFNLVIMKSDINITKFNGNNELVLDASLITALNYFSSISQRISLSSSLSDRWQLEDNFEILKKDYAFLLEVLDRSIKTLGESQLKRILKKLRQALPANFEVKSDWWSAQGSKWLAIFKREIQRCRDVGHDWNLTADELTMLRNYYAANELLFACLSGDCYLSREVREEILQSALLPLDRDEN